MSMEIDGLRVWEVDTSSGAAWRWRRDGPLGEMVEYTIEWVETEDRFLYGTRVPPHGDWNMSQLDLSVWTNDGTLDGARENAYERIPNMPR